MSKSLGNVLNLLDLIEQYDPRAYRMLLLQTHYRSPVRVGQDNIDAAVKSISGLDGFAVRSADLDEVASDAEVIAKFVEAMDDDLDTPQAIALVFETVRRANTLMDKGDLASASAFRAAVFEMCGAMGLELDASTDVEAEATEMARRLDDARASKNFAEADRLRGELQSRGYLVETTKDGTRVRRA